MVEAGYAGTTYRGQERFMLPFRDRDLLQLKDTK